MTVYTLDTFTRTANLNGATPDIGSAWAIFYNGHEDWETDGTSAYCNNAWVTSGQGFCTNDSGVADMTMTCDVDMAKGNAWAFRFATDADWNLVGCGAGSIYWYTIISNTFSQVGSTVTGLTSSGTHQFGLVLAGTTWTAYIDQVQVDQKTGQTNQQTTTKHGFRCAVGSAFVDIGAATPHYDNYRVADAFPPITTTRPVPMRLSY